MSNHVLTCAPKVWLKLSGGTTQPSSKTWDDEVVVRRYRAAAEGFDVEQTADMPVIRDGLAFLRQTELGDGELLDVGCGWGHWARVLAQQPAALHNWLYTGLEVSRPLVELCRSLNPDANFDVGTSECLPYVDHSFDVVLSSGVLTYTADWRRCLREYARVARRHVVLLRTPVVKYHATCRCQENVQSPDGDEEHWMTLFSRGELHDEIVRSGLALIDWDYTDEIYRVEGLQERLFWLSYLLEVRRSER